jgi:hypothetical protein
MARLKVDSIRNRNDDGAPSLPKGATIPSGATLTANGDLNLTGVTTVGFLTTQNAIVGIVTAGSFVGDGSGLTGLSVLGEAKAIAFAYLQG